MRRSWRKVFAWAAPPLSIAAVVLLLLVPGGDDKNPGGSAGGSTSSSAGETTSSSGGDESSSGEWLSSKKVSMRAFRDAEERVVAYLFRDGDEPLAIALQTH